MKIRYPLLVAVCLVFSLLTAHAQLPVVGDGGPGPVKAQHLTAQLVSASSAIAPGGTLQAGLVFTLDPHWHVYWANAGDAGEPPRIAWTLPTGITAGALQFPIPQRLPNGPLMDFGYEQTAAFPIQITAARSLKPGSVHLDAKVSWLVCREVCIPGRAHLGLNLSVAPNAPSAQPTGALGEALSHLPKPLPSGVKFSVMGGKSDFVLTLITGHRETAAEFYPFDQDQIVNAAPQTVEPLSNGSPSAR
jgi:DsbC/DsbD-like thiol-disulfide interchange protein